MKKILTQLKNKLEKEFNVTFDLTGKEIMERLNITLDTFRKECDKKQVDLFNGMYVEASTKYYNKIKENFDMENEITWYKDSESLDYTYVTTSDEKDHLECVSFMSDIFKEGSSPIMSTSLLEIINILQNIIENESIILTIIYDCDCHFKLEIFKDKVNVIDYDIQNTTMTNEHKKIMFYHLLYLSYNVKLNDTLNKLNLN